MCAQLTGFFIPDFSAWLNRRQTGPVPWPESVVSCSRETIPWLQSTSPSSVIMLTVDFEASAKTLRQNPEAWVWGQNFGLEPSLALALTALPFWCTICYSGVYLCLNTFQHQFQQLSHLLSTTRVITLCEPELNFAPFLFLHHSMDQSSTVSNGL